MLYLVRSQAQGWAGQIGLILGLLPRQSGSFLHLLELLSKLECVVGGPGREGQEATQPILDGQAAPSWVSHPLHQPHCLCPFKRGLF